MPEEGDQNRQPETHADGETPEEESEKPRRLGPYRILSELGRGGMGVVYKAFHEGLRRTAALKVLIAGEDASEEAIRRFHREAEAVAKLGQHPGIVPVYDIGREGEVHYFAMQYVDGKALDKKIASAEISPRRAAMLTRKIAGALHHAHEHAILHRDVKPSNVIVSEDGEPRIMDFGLARDVESEARVTRSGYTLGTPQYMSPEQAEGRLASIDARSDVYSLGATFYEMLTGRPPFQGATSLHILNNVLFEDPVPPRRFNPSVPRDLETICLKAIEKSRRKRYLTAREMEEDLERFLKGEPILARPPGLLESGFRKIRKHKMAALFFLLLLLAGAGLAGWIALQALEAGALSLALHAPAEPTLTVDGEPVALVLDMQEEGLFAAGPLELAPGRHGLEAGLEGYEPLAREFEIKAGGSLDLDLELERSTGTATLLSDPENCEIEMEGPDGTLRLTTPIKALELPTGRYRARARKKNHFPVAFAFEIERGRALPPRKIHLERIHVWSCSLPGRTPGPSGDAVVLDVDGDGAQDLLVFARGGALSCISGRWGRVLWSRSGNWSLGQRSVGDFDGDGAPECLLVVGDGSGNRLLECLACDDGRWMWRHDFGTEEKPSGPGVLFVSETGRDLDGDGADDILCLKGKELLALSGKTREVLWRVDAGQEGVPVSAGALGFLVGTREVTGFETDTGKVVWREAFPAYVSRSRVLSPGDLDGDGTGDLIAWGMNKVFFLSGGEGEIIWEREVGPAEMWGFDDVWGGWSYFGGDWHRPGGGVRFLKVVPDQDGDGGRDILIHNKTHRNILNCVSGAAGVKIWDTVLPAPLRAFGDPVDIEGDGTFELPVSLGGMRLALLEEGRGDAVRWARRGIGVASWRGTAVDFDFDGVLDLIVPADDGVVYAFSGKSGETLWSFQLDAPVGAFTFRRGGVLETVGVGAVGGDFDGSGYLDGLVVATDRAVIRLRPEPGGTAWRSEVGARASLAFAEGPSGPRILAVTPSGRMTHVDPAGGRVLFETMLARSVEGIREVRLAAFDGDAFPDVYVFDGDGLTATVYRGTDAKPLRRYRLPGNVEVKGIEDVDGDGTPDLLLEEEEGKDLFCISGATRQALWRFEPDGPEWAYNRYSVDLADVDGDGGKEVVCAVIDSSREGRMMETVTTTDASGSTVIRRVSSGGWSGLVFRKASDGRKEGAVELGEVRSAPSLLAFVPAAEGKKPQLLVCFSDRLVCCTDPLGKGGGSSGGGGKVSAGGEVAWGFHTRGRIRAVLPDPGGGGEGGRVLVGDEGGDLFCLGLEDGRLEWARGVGRPIRRLSFLKRGGKTTGEIVAIGERRAVILSPGAREIAWETTLPERIHVPGHGAFPFLQDLDGDGGDDMVLPLMEGTLLGIVPEPERFRNRPLSFGREDRFAMGQHLLGSRRFRAALAWFDDVLAQEAVPPSMEVQAHAGRARALRGLSRTSEALDAFEAALVRSPQDAGLLMERAGLLTQLGRTAEAEKDLTAVLAHADASSGRRANAFLRRARLRAGTSRHEEAVEDFASYLKEKPKDTGARLDMATSLHALGKWDESAEACKEIESKRPWDGRPKILRARALARLGRLEESMKALEAAAEGGFVLLEQISEERDFDALRDLPAFEDLLDALAERRGRWR